MQQWHAHHKVVIEEIAGMLAVRANAAHARRQVNDQVWLTFLQGAANVVQLPQVIAVTIGYLNLCCAMFAQFRHDMLA